MLAWRGHAGLPAPRACGASSRVHVTQATPAASATLERDR